MAELLFIATTIFVAYVVFVVMGGKKEKPDNSKTAAAKPAIQTIPPIEVKTTETPAPTVKPASPKPTASKAAKPAPVKAPAASTKPAATVDSMKNPKTGEVAKIPASYSFAKRWIKDALVEEGLLDKVYKNNELDDAANAKIQTALAQLKTMDKYQ